MICTEIAVPPPATPVLTDRKQDEYNLFQRIRQAIENARRLR